MEEASVALIHIDSAGGSAHIVEVTLVASELLTYLPALEQYCSSSTNTSMDVLPLALSIKCQPHKILRIPCRRGEACP